MGVRKYRSVLIAGVLLLSCMTCFGDEAQSARVYPASDPSNSGGWILNEDMSDEFEGKKLDSTKWYVEGTDGKYKRWIGRAPSQFSAANVRIENGKLYITTKWDPDFEFSTKTKPEYKSPYEKYTTAAVLSRRTFLYGYMEIKCKAADAAITSSFWTTGKHSELDIFEFVGDSKRADKDKRYPFAVHDWSTRDGEANVWKDSVELDWRVADDFHVYGCQWSEDGLKFYADGKLVKAATRAELDKAWVLTQPLMIWVDSETFYLTDVLADEACAFIERNRDKPFFAYVSFNAVHLPMETDPKDKDEFAQLEGKRRVVAQMTLSLDRACGQILNKLKELGLDENTLVVFTNDNGGPTDKNASSNYPFSGIKATHLEGGIRVPGIVAWPGKLPAGAVYDHPLSTLDLMPTFVMAAGGDEAAIEGFDGVDIVPYLQGVKTGLPHQTLYWKKENRGTIRDGDWKMMRFPDRPAELYNIAEDPAEQNNLAAAHPEMVKALFKKLFAWELVCLSRQDGTTAKQLISDARVLRNG